MNSLNLFNFPLDPIASTIDNRVPNRTYLELFIIRISSTISDKLYTVDTILYTNRTRMR